MRIAFATCSAFPAGIEDDHLVWRVLGAEYRVWNDNSVDWEMYDRVILRSVWDYTTRVEEFLSWCHSIGAPRLRNSPELVAFNADKRYLGELSVPVVPTAFLAPGDPLPSFEGEIVVKPNISAGARNTGRFGGSSHSEAASLVERIGASGRVALVQPYQATIDEMGETAIVFLDGELSHVLRKHPVLTGDGVAPVSDHVLGVAEAMLRDDLVVAGAASASERALAHRVIGEVSERFGTPLYARVDMVLDSDHQPMLLELEAIEPNLYLSSAAGASERFAEAIRRR
jgi:hypothetical protein